jgi:hypothetical protein
VEGKNFIVRDCCWKKEVGFPGAGQQERGAMEFQSTRAIRDDDVGADKVRVGLGLARDDQAGGIKHGKDNENRGRGLNEEEGFGVVITTNEDKKEIFHRSP